MERRDDFTVIRNYDHSIPNRELDDISHKLNCHEYQVSVMYLTNLLRHIILV